MVYNGSIPQPTDKLSVSQGDLLENFSELGTIFAVDHAALDDATVADRGKHAQCSLLHKGTDPSTSSGEGTIYTVKSGSDESLRWRQESDGTIHVLAGSEGGAAFAYVNFTTGAVPTINKQKNVASVTLTDSTHYTITFTSAASDTNYIVLLTGDIDSNQYPISVVTANRAVGSFRIRTPSSSTAFSRINALVYGE